jgi:hypothetical protein
MLTTEYLESFARAATARIAVRVEARDPIHPRAYEARTSGQSLAIVAEFELAGPRFASPESIPKLVARLLDGGSDMVCVAHEAWVTRVPGLDEKAFQAAMGHLAWMRDGRAEAVICAMHGRDFQTAVLHGISREGGARRLIVGPSMFEAMRIGGTMARQMPTRH